MPPRTGTRAAGRPAISLQPFSPVSVTGDIGKAKADWVSLTALTFFPIVISYCELSSSRKVAQVARRQCCETWQGLLQ